MCRRWGGMGVAVLMFKVYFCVQAELQLLMMEDDDGKKHFNLKSIMKNEKSKKKRRKKQEETKQDDFEIDVNDTRFSALYSSHLFAVDPSDPQFKYVDFKTKPHSLLDLNIS
jgi:hypothetical protein